MDLAQLTAALGAIKHATDLAKPVLDMGTGLMDADAPLKLVDFVNRDPQVLLAYFGALSGAIGAITGVIAYCRAGSMKKLDLRVELRKAVVDLRADCAALKPLIKSARRSRTAAATATGMTGAYQEWMMDGEADITRAGELVTLVPDEDETFSKLNLTAIESKLMEIHGLQAEVTRMTAKYTNALAEDDRARDRIQRSATANTAAVLARS